MIGYLARLFCERTYTDYKSTETQEYTWQLVMESIIVRGIIKLTFFNCWKEIS